MKTLLSTFILVFISLTSQAQSTSSCSHVQRSVVTDQQDIVLKAGLEYLELRTSQVLGMKIDNYVSWRGEQKGCIADVLHSAQLTLKVLNKKNEICTLSTPIHRKDHFVIKAGEESTSEYKKPVYSESCEAPTTEDARELKQCLSKACPHSKPKLFRDYYDNCSCKPFLKMIRAEDTGDLYENFYDPAKSFKKPKDLISPF